MAGTTFLPLELGSGAVPFAGETELPVACGEPVAPLSGKNFVLTGVLPIPREEAAGLIEAQGGKVGGPLSARTNYVVAGEAAGSRLVKARALGVTILYYEELQQLLAGAAA